MIDWGDDYAWENESRGKSENSFPSFHKKFRRRRQILHVFLLRM